MPHEASQKRTTKKNTKCWSKFFCFCELTPLSIVLYACFNYYFDVNYMYSLPCKADIHTEANLLHWFKNKKAHYNFLSHKSAFFPHYSDFTSCNSDIFHNSFPKICFKTFFVLKICDFFYLVIHSFQSRDWLEELEGKPCLPHFCLFYNPQI